MTLCNSPVFLPCKFSINIALHNSDPRYLNYFTSFSFDYNVHLKVKSIRAVTVVHSVCLCEVSILIFLSFRHNDFTVPRIHLQLPTFSHSIKFTCHFNLPGQATCYHPHTYMLEPSMAPPFSPGLPLFHVFFSSIL